MIQGITENSHLNCCREAKPMTLYNYLENPKRLDVATALPECLLLYQILTNNVLYWAKVAVNSLAINR